MMQSFKHFVFFTFFLLCGFGNVTNSQEKPFISTQPSASLYLLPASYNISNKTLIPTSLAKKEYWKPRGTNNEEEDDDDKSDRLKKDKKHRQVAVAVPSYLTALSFHTIAANASSINSAKTAEHHQCYCSTKRLHILFQVFRI